MTNYESMVFYSSFYEGIQKIPDDHPELKLQMYDAIMMYGLYGEEIEMDWQIQIAWESIKAQIDANIRKRISGQKGGLVKPSSKTEANSSKTEANSSETEAQPKQKEAKRKHSEANVNVNVNDNDNKNANDNVVVNVNEEEFLEEQEKQQNKAIEYYLKNINKKASEELMEDLENYVFCGMEEDCLIAIFNYCIDNDKTGWAYIKKVIDSNYKDGILTLEDYKRKQERRNAPPPEAKPEPATRSKPKSAFHNFEQRNIDFEAIEDEYFDWVKAGIKDTK